MVWGGLAHILDALRHKPKGTLDQGIIGNHSTHPKGSHCLIGFFTCPSRTIMNIGLIYRIDALISSSYTLSGGYLGDPKDLLLDDGLRGLVVGSRREGKPRERSFTHCSIECKVHLTVSAPDFIFLSL